MIELQKCSEETMIKYCKICGHILTEYEYEACLDCEEKFSDN